MPRAGSPGMTRFQSLDSFQSAISASFCLSRRCAGRACAGIITRPGMSRSKFGADAGGVSFRGRTIGLGMADPRGDAKQHRDAPALGDFDGRRREIVRLLRVGRLQHRHAGGDGVAPVVLLVLARGHAGVVGRDDDQRGGHAGVRGGEERVGGHVEADVLHRHQRARVAEGGAEGDLHRHLLIRRPLRPAAQFREAFEDLGGRGSRIARAQRDARIAGRQGNRLVAAQQPSFGLAHVAEDSVFSGRFCQAGFCGHGAGRAKFV